MAARIERRAVPMNACYKHINASRARYRVYWGSAGSGKSVNIALCLVAELSSPANAGIHCLVVRKDKDANADSTRAELISAIKAIFGDSWREEWDIPQGRLTLTNKRNGNMFLFRGVKDESQREKLKSISVPQGKIERVWIEEATQLLEHDFLQIDTRLRGELPPGHYYQVNISFNPVSSTHWLKRRFFDYEDPDAETCHTTWRDNRFIDDGFKEQMRKAREVNPEYAQVYDAGEWGTSGGLVITNWRVRELDQDITHYDAVAMGCDFGYNHANAILLLGYKDGDVYVLRESYEHGKTTSEIIEGLERSKLLADAKAARVWMICDSAEPDRIRELSQAGYRARPVDKGKGKATAAAIDWLKSRTIYVDVGCTNTADEMGEWAYYKDRTTGQYSDEPIPVHDDAMAALRYGTEPFRMADRRGKRPRFVTDV